MYTVSTKRISAVCAFLVGEHPSELTMKYCPMVALSSGRNVSSTKGAGVCLFVVAAVGSNVALIRLKPGRQVSVVCATAVVVRLKLKMKFSPTVALSSGPSVSKTTTWATGTFRCAAVAVERHES